MFLLILHYKGLFIWAKVILVSEKRFRQVYKQVYEPWYENNMKSYTAFRMRQKVFLCTEISLLDRRVLGDRDNVFPICDMNTTFPLSGINFLSCQQLFNSIHVQCYVTAGNFTRPVRRVTFLHMNRTKVYGQSKSFLANRDITFAHMNRPY